MELTNEVIELGYKHARIFLKGNRRINYEDLAHEAFVRMARYQEPPAIYLENKVRFVIRQVYRDLYTNNSTRKHNVMLNAVHTEREHATFDFDTVAVRDEFLPALKRLYNAMPTKFEILTQIISGKSIQELAAERGTSTQAVNEHHMIARRMMKELLGAA